MDLDEVNEKVEKVMDLVSTDITHRVITEWLNKASDTAKQKFGDAILAMIPEVAASAVQSRLRQWGEQLASAFLQSMQPQIEKAVREALAKQADALTASIVQRVKERVPVVADQYVTEIVKKALRG